MTEEWGHPGQASGFFFVIPGGRFLFFVIPGERSETRNPESALIHAAVVHSLPGFRISASHCPE